MRRTLLLALTLLPLIVGVSCRHPSSIAVSPAAPELTEDYCWRSASRTLLPPDSVVVRLQRAFVATGLTAGRWRQLGDTAWTASGPAVLSGNLPRATYSARGVAVNRGDSSHYRVYVAFGAPPEGWADADDATQIGRYIIPLCREVARVAAIPGVISDASPEDTLTFWTRHGPP